MTAPLLIASLESAPVGSRFGPYASERANSRPISRQPVTQQRQPSAASYDPSPLELIWSSLLESLHQGVIVTSRSLNPVYWNAKARTLCQHLSGSEFPPLELPTAVSEVCHRLMRVEQTTDRPFVMECCAPNGQTIRISARWLCLKHDQPNVRSSGREQPYILILLENCNDLLREELRIEQKKYDLTDREAEVWMLLRKEYTYQEIAKILQISLNTVKTHVKNVYAKRRSCQGREKFWCCD